MAGVMQTKYTSTTSKGARKDKVVLVLYNYQYCRTDRYLFGKKHFYAIFRVSKSVTNCTLSCIWENIRSADLRGATSGYPRTTYKSYRQLGWGLRFTISNRPTRRYG